jgi:amino acid adenylation domain-containing protein
MSLPSVTILHQQAIQARCFHPTGEWSEFPHSLLVGSIVDRFEMMVACYPDRLAVKSRTYTLNYAELNTAANSVAHRLLTTLPPAPQPIVIDCRHDVPALVAALGVLKAGKFYVFLDPQNPVEVNQQIIADIEPACILTDQATFESAEQLAPPGVCVHFIDPAVELAFSFGNPNQVIDPTYLAYITFTSGSTGQPKGVVEDHQDVLYYSGLFINYFHLCQEDRVLAITRISTGGAWVSIYPSLLSGGSVFLFDVQQEGIAPLSHWIAQAQITVMAMAVSIFRELAPLLHPHELAGLRLLGLGSETIHASDFKLYQERCPDHTILRIAFGCTEAHFISYHFWDKASPPPVGPTPVGYPAGDAEILILNEDGSAAATGETGEIAVCRTYLSVGYWHNPGLTAVRYRSVTDQPGKRLYLLGDRGYKQADGCLVHLGRMDNRVKIRGHFVDLDAIERTLAQLDDVEQAAAIVAQMDQNDVALIAYLQVHPKSQATVSLFYQQMVNRLPSHLLPRAIVLMEQMPLTLSGKIDRSALPKPDAQRPLLATPYRVPCTALEERLAAVWQEVLAIAPIGVDDNFLELGGDSLRAMMVMNRLHSLSTSFIHVRHLFDAPTIATFSRFLARHYPAAMQKLTGEVVGTLPGSIRAQTQNPEKLDPATVQQIRTWLSVFRRQPPIESANSLVWDTKNSPALFVLSSPRSGSTLFRVLLAGHPQLFAPPEMALIYFNTLQERSAVLDGLGAGEREGALRAIMAAIGCDSEVAQRLMHQMEAENLTTQAFYRQLQNWIHPRLLVEKTPGYAYNIETLRQAEVEFNEPLYIHLVRHPYGMIHSYVEDKTALRLLTHLRHRFPDLALPSITEELPIAPKIIAEAIWLIVQQNINTFFTTIPAQRRLLIHFEELVQQPAVVMERVCTFLGIALHPAMLQPYADPSIRMTDGINALSLMTGDPKFNQHKQIDPAVANHWREHYAIDFLSDLTWEVAEQLGYAREVMSSVSKPGGTITMDTTHSFLDDLLSDLEKLPFHEAQGLLTDLENPIRSAHSQE